MNRANFPGTLAFLALFLCIALGGTLAQGETGTFAGRVVDVAGNPVADLPIFVWHFEVEDELDWFASAFFPADYPLLRRARTDADGRFSIVGIPPGPAYCGALPFDIEARLPSHVKEMSAEEIDAFFLNALESGSLESLVSSSFGMEQADFEPDVEVLSLRIHGISFYPRNDYEEILFGIRPGMQVENAIVTVQPRMRLRGQILLKDGAPLSNARVGLNVRSRQADGRGTGGSSSAPWTDAEGYFVHYLNEKDNDAFYTVVAVYKGLEAETEPVLLKPGERYDGLVLRFDSEPSSSEPETQVKTEPAAAPKPKPKLGSNEVWIVNPANSRAYKRILCETRDEALTLAAAEDAQLVSINDADEQQWVSAVFGGDFYWIGLSRTATGWQWSDGTPVTYENWLPTDFFSEQSDASEHNAALMTIEDGKWYRVNAASVITRLTRMAIIEKEITP